MCTICGIGLLKGHVIYNATLIRELTTELLKLNTGYNKDATGIAYCSKDKITIVKKNSPGQSFVNSAEYLEESLENTKIPSPQHPDIIHESSWDKSLISILGHCRFKTQGSELNNVNNHPIVCDEVVGVHNGVINNDYKLFNTYKSELQRIGEVDSEIIFSLINYYSKEQISNKRNYNLKKAIQRTVAQIKGSMACALVHKKHPNLVWLFRRNTPCTLHIYKRVGLIMWSTIEESMKNAVENVAKMNIGKPTKLEFSSNSGICIDLERHKFHKFDII